MSDSRDCVCGGWDLAPGSEGLPRRDRMIREGKAPNKQAAAARRERGRHTRMRYWSWRVSWSHNAMGLAACGPQGPVSELRLPHPPPPWLLDPFW